jgi:DNA-binding transcriptional ArsR family regulator
MAVVLRFGRLGPAQVSFAYSPAQEALHSLHVLRDAREHPLHVPWVVRAREKLSPALKAEIDRFAFLFRRPLPVLWDLMDTDSLQTFADDMTAFRRQPPDLFATALLNAAFGLAAGPVFKHCPDEPAALAHVCAAAIERQPQAADLFTALMANPAHGADRFADLMEAYWDACLGPEWPEIEEMFARDIALRGRRLLQKGIAGTLEGLSPDMQVDRDHASCVVVRATSREVTLAESDRICLVPSYFAWPHLFMSAEPPVVLISYPVVDLQREGRAPVPPERLLKLLRAAGDMSRLQILQLLAKRPRTTGELAGLIGISEPAVSKHLKQLQEAGLVTAERQSYYVFYRTDKAPAAELARGLEGLLAGDEG